MLRDGLPERLRTLDVSIGDRALAGQLLKTSVYEFRYLDAAPDQPAVALLMPPSERLTWQDGDLFAPMDQNLPEGDLFMRIRQLFPKRPMTPMHLLALVGRNGIGRLGYQLPDAPDPAPAPPDHPRAGLLRMKGLVAMIDVPRRLLPKRELLDHLAERAVQVAPLAKWLAGR